VKEGILLFRKTRGVLLACIIILVVLFSACSQMTTGEGEHPKEELLVHFIDVGQGDGILIQQGGQNMLIDAGENNRGEDVVTYLRNHGVDQLDYVIGTHPHSDHIGGLDTVIDSFKVGKVLLPRVSHTTKTFEDVLLAIKDSGLKVTTPKVGDEYLLGDGTWTILAPNSEDYDNLNNYSIIIRLDFHGHSFLFTGDAEVLSEEEMLQNSLPLKSDVLKLGHHGSSTSTGDDFLKKVDPRIAIIQVGEDNSYGHPNRETLERLDKSGVTIYRNDIHGTILLVSDGEKIRVESEKEVGEGASTPLEVTYIGNQNSKVFHLETCGQLPAKHNQVILNSRDEAVERGFTPCSRCNP